MNQVQTTTEELIVSYLDGELQRNELEVMLFERLATSEEARMILREHLVLRGAIRQHLADASFELSADLDRRTRAKIEEMLRSMPAPMFEESPVLERKVADAAPVQAPPAERRLKRWSMRPAIALAVLLLAVSGTWYLTHTTDATHTTQLAANTAQEDKADHSGNSSNNTSSSNASSTSPASEEKNMAPAATPASHTVEPKEHIVYKTVVKYVPAKNAGVSNADVATTAETHSTKVQPNTTEEGNADAMISRRYPKLLKSSNIVAVTSQDRISD